MEMKMKYVMLDGCYPIIFSPSLNHSDMAKHGNVTSAGFLRVKDGKIVTSDRSDTLKIGPDPDDAYLIAVFLGMQGADHE